MEVLRAMKLTFDPDFNASFVRRRGEQVEDTEGTTQQMKQNQIVNQH